MVNFLALLVVVTPRVALVHLPSGSIQPQTAIDAAGTVHIVYFRGPAEAGNIYYSTIPSGASSMTAPVRVNSLPGTASAIGTVRSAQIAVGRGGRVFVAWNGLGPKASNGYPVAYEAFARSSASRDQFEPQRNLTTWAKGLDGGGTVAADQSGNVFVLWHALGGASDEAGAGVFLARSSDDGATFSREVRIDGEGDGACGCCGMRAADGLDGTLEVVYRGARNGTGRDSIELHGKADGTTFTSRVLDPWKLNACPMSTYSLYPSKFGMAAAWETGDHVYAGWLAPNGTISKKWTPPGQNQKHPTVALGADGGMLLAWTVGTGWQRGGALAWSLVEKDAGGIESGRIDGAIDTWSLPSAVARPDGRFVIVY